MKLILKIIGILLVIIVALLVAVPYFFRDQIAQAVKDEINKNINAQVDFADFSLSLFKSFPDFNFGLEKLVVINNAPFEGDTLAFIPSFELTLDLMSVIKGENYIIKEITIRRPYINLKVNDEDKANWDITLESEEPATQETANDESTPLTIRLKYVTLQDGLLVYDDKPLATTVVLNGLNHTLSGDFTADFTTLKTTTKVNRATVIFEKIKYLDKVNLVLDAAIDADLVNSIYTLKKNELRINRLSLGFDGSVALQDNDDINLMLTYQTKKSDFKSFLSLIPAIYQNDFDGITTSGSLQINGNVKGIYNEDTYPAFTVNLAVQNGMFRYPDLPESVDHVNIKATVSHPGGDFDNMTVNVAKMHFAMAGNPFDFSLLLKTPLSDPQVKGELNGRIDLSQIARVYPLEQGEELKGKVIAKMLFDGKISSLENDQYDQFQLLGSLLLENFMYSSPAFAQPVEIHTAQLNFSPEYLDLVNFKMNIGKSDLSAKGKIENFMPYIFSDKMLTGKLETGSNHFNISDLLEQTGENDQTTGDTLAQTTTGEPATDTVASTEIPGNINFAFNANFKELVYDNIEMFDVKGMVFVRNKAVVLDKLKMNVMDGLVDVSGKYDTKEPENPEAEMQIKITNINIQKAYLAFDIFKQYLPVAEKIQGRFSTSFNFNTLLDKELMPVYPTMNGNGNLKTSAIVVGNIKLLNKMADLLKVPDLKQIKSGPVNLSFEFTNGRLKVKPFKIKYQDMGATISGTTGFDQTIDYDVILNIPRDKFGQQANALLDNLINQANQAGANFSINDVINLKLKVGGTLTNPTVKTDFAGNSGNIKEDLKKKAMEELEKQKQKLEEEARKELEKKKAEAKKEADKIIADAKARADKIIKDAQAQADAWNKTAKEAADKAKKEAQKQAENIIAEAKKNGPLAEMAAKTATEKLLKEADNKADKLLQEAQKKSNNLIKEARKKADKINADARQQAGEVLKRK